MRVSATITGTIAMSAFILATIAVATRVDTPADILGANDTARAEQIADSLVDVETVEFTNLEFSEIYNQLPLPNITPIV